MCSKVTHGLRDYQGMKVIKEGFSAFIHGRLERQIISKSIRSCLEIFNY
jgi:hypothetical protein